MFIYIIMEELTSVHTLEIVIWQWESSNIYQYMT